MTSLFKHMYPRFQSCSNESLSSFIGGDQSFKRIDQCDFGGDAYRFFWVAWPFKQQEFSRSFGAVDHKGLPRLPGSNGYGLVPPLSPHGVVPPSGELVSGAFVPGRAA